MFLAPTADGCEEELILHWLYSFPVLYRYAIEMNDNALSF